MDVGRLVCDVRYSSRCVAPVSRDTAPGPARTVCLFCVLMMMSRGPPICGDRCGMQAWVASWSLRTLFSSCSFSRPESSWREEGDGRGDFWGVTITGTGDRFDSRRGRVEASRRGRGRERGPGRARRLDRGRDRRPGEGPGREAGVDVVHLVLSGAAPPPSSRATPTNPHSLGEDRALTHAATTLHGRVEDVNRRALRRRRRRALRRRHHRRPADHILLRLLHPLRTARRAR